MRSRPAARSALGALLALVGACSQGVDVPPPRAFNRPARVELVCFEGDTPVPRTGCDAGDNGAIPNGRTLMALVPQKTRGEVAAVDLTAEDGPVVIDSDRRVPGFTFVQVGEIPSALAVSRVNPTCTWVANLGSSDISAVQTARFREESLADDMRMDPPVSLAGDGRFGRPQAMVIHDTAGASELYVTLPLDGAIARIPVTASESACSFGAVEIIPLPDLVPEPPTTPIDEPTVTGSTDLAVLAVCRATAETPAPELSTPAPVAVQPLPDVLPPPAPREMIVERNDAGEGVALWIGDAARPVIYRYDLATRTFDGGIRTDGPVRDLAITPPVPDSFAAGAPTRRYLYAIDHRDGTVMVIDTSSGHVIPVAAELSGRPLRIPLPAQARAIEVVDRRGTGLQIDDPSSTMECADAATSVENAANFLMLRGVFVAIALSDGTVRFVDVLDEDALCRGASDCNNRLIGAEKYVLTRRHRPRIGERLAELVSIVDAPTVTLGGGSFRYSDEGKVPGGTDAPEFAQIDCNAGGTTTDGISSIFGNVNRICALTDPWSSLSEQWAITWQGTIPNTSNPGNFRDDPSGGLAIDTRLELCALGALGRESAALAPAGSPESTYPGDLVAIVTELPEAARDRDECEMLAGVDAGEDPEALLVPTRAILARAPTEASPYRSTILFDASAPVVNRPGFTIENVRDCYSDELLTFELRVNDRFAVVGARAGFPHRVIADDASGQCRADETQPATLTSRAELGVEFVSERLRFQLNGTPPAEDAEVRIRFDVSDVPSQLLIDLGASQQGREITLPGELLFSDQNDTLYVIDELRRGLVPTTFEPLKIVTFVE